MRLALLAAALLAMAPTGAHAAVHSFSGFLTIEFGGLASVRAGGAGYGVIEGGGNAASIPADVWPLATTVPISPPLLVIDGFGVGAPGHAGGTLPLDPGTNKALSWNGVTGTMGLSLSAYLITDLQAPTTLPTPTNIVAAIPLAIVGVGGNQKFAALGGLIMGSVIANPYQLGVVTVMGSLSGVPATLMGTGFDWRTAGGFGALQLVSPAVVSLGVLGSIPVLATMYVFTPEPATALLLGLGLVALGAVRRRYR